MQIKPIFLADRFVSEFVKMDNAVGFMQTQTMTAAAVAEQMSDIRRARRTANQLRQDLEATDPTRVRLARHLTDVMASPPADLLSAWVGVRNASDALLASYKADVVPLMDATGSWNDASDTHDDATLTLPAAFIAALADLKTALGEWT